jgi:hypothetical protein
MKKEDVPEPGQKVTVEIKTFTGETHIQWATVYGIPFQDGWHTESGGWVKYNTGKLNEYPCFKLCLRGYKQKRSRLWCLESIEAMTIGWKGERTF